MPGLGVGAEEQDRGDQLVTLEVEYPVDLDEADRELIHALADRIGPEAFPRTTRFDREIVPFAQRDASGETSENE